jgi:hypothetical protein
MLTNEQEMDRQAKTRRIRELEADVERLQRIIDGRPAINAGLPESYIRWSQSIYELEFTRATLSRS